MTAVLPVRVIRRGCLQAIETVLLMKASQLIFLHYYFFS
jgi:hypothetical protein